MSIKDEPPDKYQCLKIPIRNILHKDIDNNETIQIINNAVMRTNVITTKTYFLLRLWVLQKYNNQQEIPEITEDTIRMCMKSVMKSSAGPKPK